MFKLVGFIVVMGLAYFGARGLYYRVMGWYEDAMAYREDINN